MADKYYIARGTGPIIETTLPEIRESILKGELSATDLYCRAGASRYEKISSLPEYPQLSKKAANNRLINQTETPSSGALKSREQISGGSPSSPTPRSYLPPRRTSFERRQWTPPAQSNDTPQSLERSSGNVTTPTQDTQSSDSDDEGSFWMQPTRPQLFFWSAVSYTLVSIPFTPLLGTILIDANHRMAHERTWRTIPLFWIALWSLFALSVLLDRIIRGWLDWPVWVGGYCGLALIWFFTCALPHRLFLQQQPNDIGWRSDWGRPLGIGLLVLVLYFSAFLLPSA